MSVLRSVSTFALFMGCSALCHAAPLETVLYSFTGGSDEGHPSGSLVADASGNLYGTTSSYYYYPNFPGTVFKLTRPAAGGTAWTQTVLHTFTGGTDGVSPAGALAIDANGNLYGATSSGGAFGQGTIYELTPPVAGQTSWTETILHSFDLTDGASPIGGLIIGGHGVLYGTTSTNSGQSTTYGFGLVFALRPPEAGQTTWTERVLHKFHINPNGLGRDGAYPNAGVVADKAGNLFGTTDSGGPVISAYYGRGLYGGAGVVYELSPPAAGQTKWTETILYDFSAPVDGFNPDAGLALDDSGSLYGTTANATNSQGSGVIFKLTPPPAGQTGWTETLVLNDDTVGDPYGYYNNTPILNRYGEVFAPAAAGGLYGNGGILKLTPPVSGQTAWTETFFPLDGRDGAGPEAGLAKVKHDGHFYGTTVNGGAYNMGTVFSIKQ